MSDTIPSSTPERPNLEREPLLIATVQNMGLGAIMGAAAGLGSNAISALRKEKVTGKGVLKDVLWLGGMTAGALGLVRLVGVGARNEERRASKPYVERLEQELAARDIATTPQQR